MDIVAAALADSPATPPGTPPPETPPTTPQGSPPTSDDESDGEMAEQREDKERLAREMAEQVHAVLPDLSSSEVNRLVAAHRSVEAAVDYHLTR